MSTVAVTRVAQLAADGSLSTWMLIGMMPEDDATDAWSYRTGAIKTVRPVRIATNEAAVLIDESWGAWPLSKRGQTVFANTILVGRATTNDVCIVDGSISKLHARVRRGGGALWLSDAGSSNGTVVNGDGIAAGDEVLLSTGDLVRFGARVFQVFSPEHLTTVLRFLRTCR